VQTQIVLDGEVPLPEERFALWQRICEALAVAPSASAVRQRARTVRDLIRELDSYIQDQTAAVCPDCDRVCCINQHAFHDRADLLYLAALGRPLPQYREPCPQRDPCQFLGAGGCSIPREFRPYRCNWYFCVRLLRFMDENASPASRRFSAKFQQIIDARREMIEIFLRSTPD
jgi:hypothetical protein